MTEEDRERDYVESWELSAADRVTGDDAETEGDREPPPDPADYCPECSDALDSHSAAGCRLCACPQPGPFRSAPGR